VEKVNSNAKAPLIVHNERIIRYSPSLNISRFHEIKAFCLNTLIIISSNEAFNIIYSIAHFCIDHQATLGGGIAQSK
jgi:hypothetical protein